MNIDLVIEGRRPLPIDDGAAWATLHLAWALQALAEGPDAGIAEAEQWRIDLLELVDGAAWWLANQIDGPTPPVLSSRKPGY